MRNREALTENARRYRPFIAALVAATLVAFVRPPLADESSSAAADSLPPQVESGQPFVAAPNSFPAAQPAASLFPTTLGGPPKIGPDRAFPPPPAPGGGDVPPGALALPDLPNELDPVLALLTPTVGEACNASGITAGIVSLIGGLRQIEIDENTTIPIPQEVTDTVEFAIANALLGCGYLPLAPTKSECGVDDDILAAGLGVEGLYELQITGAVIDTIYAAEYLTGAGGNAPLLILGPLLGPYFRCFTEVND